MEKDEQKEMLLAVLKNQEAMIATLKDHDKRLGTMESYLSGPEFEDLKESVRTFKQIFHGDPNLGLSPLLDRVNKMWLNYDRMRWLLALALLLGMLNGLWEWLKAQIP